MHEITATKKAGTVEFILEVDIFHAEFAEAVANIDFGSPVIVCHLAAETDIGQSRTRVEAVAAGSIDRTVKKDTACRSDGEFIYLD